MASTSATVVSTCGNIRRNLSVAFALCLIAFIAMGATQAFAAEALPAEAPTEETSPEEALPEDEGSKAAELLLAGEPAEPLEAEEPDGVAGPDVQASDAVQMPSEQSDGAGEAFDAGEALDVAEASDASEAPDVDDDGASAGPRAEAGDPEGAVASDSEGANVLDDEAATSASADAPASVPAPDSVELSDAASSDEAHPTASEPLPSQASADDEALASAHVEASAAQAVAPKRPAASVVARMVAAKPLLTGSFKRATPAQVASSQKRPAVLAAGEYLLRRADTNVMLVDVAGSSKKAGAAIQLATSANAGSQKWKLVLNWLGYYTIANAASGSMLDYDSTPAAGRNIIQAAQAQSASQFWVLQKKGNAYLLRSAMNPSFVVECNGNGTGQATKLVLRRATGKAAQQFAPMTTHPNVKGGATVAQGVYLLSPRCASTYMGVAGASQASGANVHTSPSAINTAQRWVLSLGKDGFYQLANVSSGLMLDVAGGDYVPTTNVWQSAANGTDAQKWAIRANGDGTYTLISKKNALALDVCDGSSSAGANLWMYWPNGSDAQKFELKKVDLLADGIYSFYSRTAPTSRVLDVVGGSTAQDAQLQACAANGTFAQKFKVVRVGANAYTLQVAASGKYVTDSGSGIVQRSKAGKAPADNQVWQASWAKGGVVLTNKKTGKVVSTGTTPAASGTPLARVDAPGKATEAFRAANVSLVDRGIYTLRTQAGRAQLATRSGSLAGGANLQMGTASNANAQKFLLSPVADGYYQIMLVLAGTTATVVDGSGNNHANVKLYAYTGAPSQQWRPEVTDAGVVFVNKNSGKVLEAASARNGGNVRQARPTGKANQVWTISPTTVNVNELDSLLGVIASAKGDGTTATTPGMHGYTMGPSPFAKLSQALSRAWNRGIAVGFVLSDVTTGATISLCADDSFYGASTMKAAYVTYIFDWLLESGEVSKGSMRSLIENTIVWSDNDTYAQLRGMFGSGGFRKWLDEAEVGGLAGEYYPFNTPRKLQKVWARIMAYEESGGRHVSWWRNTFNHSYMSFIHDGLLYKASAVYSKPGWMEKTGSAYDAYADSAIVTDESGRKFLMSIMSDANPYVDKGVMEGIARALYDAHARMPVS